jgi:hypothetical protein
MAEKLLHSSSQRKIFDLCGHLLGSCRAARALDFVPSVQKKEVLPVNEYGL